MRFLRNALATAAVVAIAAPAYAQNPKYGVVTSVFDYNHKIFTSHLNAGSIRLDFEWKRMQASNGTIDWAATDDWMNRAAGRGQHVLASVGYTPSWAGPCEQKCMPYNLLDWQNFFRAVLERYHTYPNVTFGVWNEPNLSQFLQDDGQATQYKKLFEHAAIARDLVNTSISLAGPETSWHAYSQSSYLANALTKIQPYMRSQDVITVHWYDDANVGLHNYMAGVANYLGNGRDIWLTEANCTTTTPCSNDVNQAWAVYDILAIFDAAQSTIPSWKRSFIYVLQNNSWGSDAIINPDWSPRTAYYWMRDRIQGNSVTGRWVSFQASNGNYMVAEGNGGDVVNANRTGIGAWETFWLWDTNGGDLMSGDTVFVMTSDGWYFRPDNGCCNTPLVANGTGPTPFLVVRVAGDGKIESGTQIGLAHANPAFPDANSSYFVAAEGGGGQEVNVRTWAYLGPWETFTIIFH